MRGMQMNRLPRLLAMSAAFTWFGATAGAGELTMIHSIEFPIVFIYGTDITWDGTLLWATPVQKGYSIEGIPFPESSFGLDPSDGSQTAWIRHVDPISANRRGFTWDGESFWIATHSAVIDLPVDIAEDRMHRFSANGELAETFVLPLSPDAMPGGLASDGTDLWLSDLKHSKIMKIDPADMTVISLFDSPGPEPRGLTWDGSSLWCVDGTDGLIYQMDPSGNVTDAWSALVTDPWGITYDGQHLWILDNDARRIFQLAVPEPGTLGLTAVGCAGVLLFLSSIGKLGASLGAEIES